MLKRYFAVIICAAVVFTLFSACLPNSNIPDQTDTPAPISSSYDTDITPQSPTSSPIRPTTEIPGSIGTHYGSYLTMYGGGEFAAIPYMRKMTSYADVAKYFFETDRHYIYGARFTSDLAYFNDEFFEDNDLLILVISDTSTYAGFALSGLTLDGGKAVFNIERHIPEDAPESGFIIYHLLFTVPKDSFAGVSDDSFDIQMNDITSLDNTTVYDAERYRFVYPEYWPFCHATESLSPAGTPVASIFSYDELLRFYDLYKKAFDLDKEFVKRIGPVYDEALFEEYILLLAILPYDSRFPEPKIENLYVYNLNIWIVLSSMSEYIPEEFTKWHILSVAVAKKDLKGVKMNEFNIGA